MKNTPKKEKMNVKIDNNTAQKLAKLGNMGETPSNLIKKLVEHAYICDKWWIERDGDEL